jgi:hypothetical protein
MLLLTGEYKMSVTCVVLALSSDPSLNSTPEAVNESSPESATSRVDDTSCLQYVKACRNLPLRINRSKHLQRGF